MSREVYVPYEYTSYYIQRFGLEDETSEHHEEMVRRVNEIDNLVKEFIKYCVRNKILIYNYDLGTFEKLLYDGYSYDEAFEKIISGYVTNTRFMNLLKRIERMYLDRELTYDEIREFYEKHRDKSLREFGREGPQYKNYLESDCAYTLSDSDENSDSDEYNPYEQQEKLL